MMRALVDAVKRHALEHYNAGGWDVVVECWDDAEIAEYLEGYHLGDVVHGAPITTAEQAIAAFAPLVDVWSDRQANARIEGFDL